MVKIHCIILAAGLGTRMAPLTKYKPKPLVLYEGTPLVSRIINQMYRFCDAFTVVTKYFNEQFDDLPYSYKKVRLQISAKENMASSFLDAARQVTEDVVVGVSSDIAFDEIVVKQAFGQYDSGCVHVFLTHSNLQGYKKWHWVINDGLLEDLKVDKNPTGYEKLFILFPLGVLRDYTNNFHSNMATSEEEFQGHEEYNTGWIYLIHRLLENRIKIRATVLEGNVTNINSISDLKPI